MTATEQAMTVCPMLLVSDWTIIIAMEKTPCVMPAGRPSFSSRRVKGMSRRTVRRFKSMASRIRNRRSTHSTAETSCEKMVATAAPATLQGTMATSR